MKVSATRFLCLLVLGLPIPGRSLSLSAFAQSSSPSDTISTPASAHSRSAHDNRWESKWSQLGCDSIWAKLAKRPHLTLEQLGKMTSSEREEYDKKYPPITPREFSALESCKRAAPARNQSTLNPNSYPSPYSVHTHKIVPLPPPQQTPSPPAVPLSSTVGPFSSFLGGDVSACSMALNQPPQPPDLAADVSPTQNAELLNQGLWIFNKDGTAAVSGQTTANPYETLNTFWCGRVGGNGQLLPGCGQQNLLLSEPQIAWDSVDRVWLATTMAQGSSGTGTLYFAYSVGPNANDTQGNWERWSTPLCNGQQSDMPILGYGQDWVVIDTLCHDFHLNQVADTITLIPNSDVTDHTFNPQSGDQTSLPNTVFGWRPSRDVSNSAFGFVYLVASVVNGSISPFALLSSINTLGQIASPTSLPATGGQSTDTYILPSAVQGSCTSSTSSCAIDLGNAAIHQAIVQFDPVDNKHYFLTSFAAGLGSAGSESLYYLLQVETNSVHTVIVGSSSYELAYPSIVADQDQDFYLTNTSFAGSSDIWTSWYFLDGWLNIKSQNYLNFSTGTYMGDLSCPQAFLNSVGATM